MHARSSDALAAKLDGWESVLRESAGQAGALAAQVLGVVDILDDSAGLRRALTDPNRSGGDRAALASRVLEGKVDPVVVDLVAGMVRRQWSAEADLSHALAQVGRTTYLVSAEQAGRLEQVESELHGVSRLMATNPELRSALLDRDTSRVRREGLIDAVLGSKVSYETLQVVRRIFGKARTANVPGELVQTIDAAAARRAHLVASVRAAVPLSDQQIARLSDLLAQRYGRPVDVHVGIDPEVLGGIRVRVGDELLDDTISRRLDDARRRLSA